MTSARTLAWALFDDIVAESAGRDSNPWSAQTPGAHPAAPEVVFAADYDTLSALLGVPVLLGATSQSGVPALAVDVWVAYELRRAGFDPDAVWPRAEEPRVLPSELLRFAERLPDGLAHTVRGYLRAGYGGASAANLLGKNYVKQVDVVMSAWSTGPELMISTKRMDSSFGKNAANRVEESYGDAKNLRLRHPRAALGFVFALSARAFEREPLTAERIVDLLIKLGREDDAYDAVALVVPDLAPEQEAGADAADPLDGDAAAEVSVLPVGDGGDLFAAHRPSLSDVPVVPLRHAPVPPELDPGRFLRVMAERVLDNSPVDFHREARRRRSQATPSP